MRLNDWQLKFERYLVGDLATVPAELSTSLIGGPTLTVNDGLAIYHHAYRARLQEVLRADYPALRHWLGDDEFEQLAAVYIRVSPSTHFSLRWMGEGFAAFINQHLVCEQGAAVAELATLEWAFTLAFDALEGTPLTLQALAHLPPEAWPCLRFSLTPGVQWLTCHYNSLALWRCVKEGSAFPGSAQLDQPQVLLIWRCERVCQYRSLASAEAIALQGLVEQGWSFAELCGALLESHREEAPLQAATWLKQWTHDGWLQVL